MTGGRASMIWLAVLAVAVAVFALVWLVPHLNRVSEQTETISKLEEEGGQLSARVQQLAQELNVLLSDPDEDPGPDVDALYSAAAARARAEAEKRLVNVRVLSETQERLDQASATIDDMGIRIAEFERSVTSLQEENETLKSAQEELRDQLDRSERVVEAMRTELKDSSGRLVTLEKRNRSLLETNQEQKALIATSKKLLEELDGIQRRRESLLTNIVRRYREVSDSYRATALSVSSRQPDENMDTVDMSRIQHALSLADEDLEQIRSLNDREQQIRRQLDQ